MSAWHPAQTTLEVMRTRAFAAQDPTYKVDHHLLAGKSKNVQDIRLRDFFSAEGDELRNQRKPKGFRSSLSSKILLEKFGDDGCPKTYTPSRTDFSKAAKAASVASFGNVAVKVGGRALLPVKLVQFVLRGDK